MKKPLGNSSAEKRVLWEVRQRFKIDTPHSETRRSSRSIAAPPSHYPPPHQPARPRPKTSRGRMAKRLALGTLLLLLLSGGVFGYKILAAGNKISTTDRSLIGQLTDLLFSQGKQLAGESDGRINILLLAIGGEGHQGQNLADTIIVVSIRSQEMQAALLSIPRDLHVQVPGQEYYAKINAVHAYGESQEQGQGPHTLSQKVTEITGLPIHYYGRIDFAGFKRIVDAVGGININIENTFLDYWHKIAFSAGTEKMDGDRALAYVRARYIEGPEGGDFKRAARQQQVLLALQQKVFSVNTALDFTALSSILDSASDNIRTDLSLWEMKRLYEIARQVDQKRIVSHILTTGPAGVLVGTTEVLGSAPASVLKPRAGDYSEIQALAASMFTVQPNSVTINSTSLPSEKPSASLEPTPTPDAPPAKPTIEIRNGTNLTGLAKKISDELTSQSYQVVAIGNAGRRDITKTIVYVLNDRAASGSAMLAQRLSAATASGLPGEEVSTKADVLIILGTDSL